MYIKCASTLLLVLTSAVAAESSDSIDWQEDTGEKIWKADFDAYINPESIISDRETGVYCAFNGVNSRFYDARTLHLRLFFEVCSTLYSKERIQISIADDEEILGNEVLYKGRPGLQPGYAALVDLYITIYGYPEEGEEYLLYLVCTRERSFEKAKQAYKKADYLRVPIVKVVRSSDVKRDSRIPVKTKQVRVVLLRGGEGNINEAAAPLPGAPKERLSDKLGEWVGGLVGLFAIVCIIAAISNVGSAAITRIQKGKVTRSWDDWGSDELRDKKLRGDQYKIESSTGFRGSKDRYGRRSLSQADQEAIDAVLRKRGEE